MQETIWLIIKRLIKLNPLSRPLLNRSSNKIQLVSSLLTLLLLPWFKPLKSSRISLLIQFKLKLIWLSRNRKLRMLSKSLELNIQLLSRELSLLQLIKLLAIQYLKSKLICLYLTLTILTKLMRLKCKSILKHLRKHIL